MAYIHTSIPRITRPTVARPAETGEYLDGLRLRLSGGTAGAGLKRLRAALEQGGEALLIQNPQAQSLGLISFEPAFAPATTKWVFFETEPEALPPREIIASFAPSRV